MSGAIAKDLVEQRLVALFAAGCLLFNFPLLALWDRDVMLLGAPLFPAALFLLWAVLIAALGWIVEHGDDDARVPARAGAGRPAAPGVLAAAEAPAAAAGVPAAQAPPLPTGAPRSPPAG